MSNEPIKIKLNPEWGERFDRAADAAGKIADALQRIAKGIEKLAEYKRQEYL